MLQISTLFIPRFLESDLLKELANISDNELWGFSLQTNGVTLMFKPERQADVEAALTNYDSAYLSRKKLEKLEELATIRREKELKGPMGLVLDATTVANLTGAATGLMLDPTIESINWEVSRGVFSTLSRETVLSLAVGAFKHRQACFNTVFQLTQQINAINLDNGLTEALMQLADIDLTTGWPT